MEEMVDEKLPATVDRSAPETADWIRFASEDWTILFQSIARGDRSALHDLYDLAATSLYGFALWRTHSPEDAADIVQEVFVKVAQQGPRLAQIRKPKTWLLTVARRLTIDLARRRKVREADELDEHPYLEAAAADPVRSLDTQRASTHLARLPDKQRDAIYLKHFADCSFSDIGRIVGVPTFTAASRYRTGMERLRRLMEEP